MTAHHLVATAQRLLAGVVLVLSGAYMMIYLYRWEWNRAIISGVFFVAAEVALATSMVLRRLRALEGRDPAHQGMAPPAALERIRATPVDRPDVFGWLRPRDWRLGVFVPVLLGAGAILSALAYVIERVAEATALPSVDRRLASRLSVVAPPEGGLHGDGSPAPSGPRRTPTLAVAATLAIAAVTVIGWLGVQALIEATQTRPDPADRPVRTTIELTIAQRSSVDGAVEAAEALWVGCRSTLGSLPVVADVAPRGGDEVALILEPGVGRLGVRRLTGCLSDLRVNLVKAAVRSVETVD